MKTVTHISMLALFLAISMQAPSMAQVPWTKDAANPVMSGVGTSDWHVFFPRVLHNPDSSRFEMWYSATSSFTNDFGRPYRIGFATSPDGLQWTRYPTPVLEADPGTWDARTVEGHTVLREEGIYKMWYSASASPGASLAIGYATSTDGITWTKYSGNPVMTPDTTKWEAAGVGYPSVRGTGDGGYEMWYSGFDGSGDNGGSGSIGYAISQDGITWSKADSVNPVLVYGNAGSWDDNYVATPSVVKNDDGMYHLWYSGGRVTDSPRWIGYATSEDGIHWDKYDKPETGGMYVDSDPIISPTGGQWDGAMVEGPSVMKIENTWHMWYAGRGFPFSTETWEIGHATALDVTGTGLEPAALPSRHVLDQNFPNPFNPTTTISYNLLKSSEITLTVYDVLGRLVSVLASGMQPAGAHTVRFDAAGRPPGVYYYRLEAEGFVETRQMVLIR